MGVHQLGPHDDFHRRAAKQSLVDIQAGTIVKIAHQHQRHSCLQMILDPRPQPDCLCQLLAPVGDGNRAGILGRPCAMRSLGFQMRADQAKGQACARGDLQLHRRFGKAHQIRPRIHIEVDLKTAVKARRLGRGDWCMDRLQHRCIIEEGDLLLGVIGKAHHHVTGAQPGPIGKILQRPQCVLVLSAIGGLHHDDAIRIDRSQHRCNRVGLRPAADAVPSRWPLIKPQPVRVIKEVGEPFDVIRAQAHDLGPAQCRLYRPRRG